jgi:cytochrome c553
MKFKTLTTALIFFVFFTLLSCDKEGGSESKISSNNKSESHKNGENCMNCHKNGGDGEGWFYVAGSIYTMNQQFASPNGKVKIYSGPDGSGTLMATIEVDALGNFYTTESVSFSGGVYTSVQSSGGTEKFMDSKITTGACNSCHGISEDKIWVN